MPPARLRKWWRLYVHKIQKKYAIFAGLLVFSYCFLVLYLTFLGPYVAPSPLVVQEMSWSERLAYATQFLLQGKIASPAIIFILVPSAVLFSLYVTHRVAGPLYRLEQYAKELEQGNLALRIRLRKGDDLQEIAGTLNVALANIDQALVEIRDHEAPERKALQRCVESCRAQPLLDQELVEQLELAAKEAVHIDAVFKRFRLSKP